MDSHTHNPDDWNLTIDFDKEEQTILEALNGYIHNEGDPNKNRDDSGNTFLHIAVDKNFKKVAKLLLEHGMDALVMNKWNKIALEKAMEKDNDEMGALIVRNMKSAEIKQLMYTTGNGIKKKLIENNSSLTETLLAVFNSLTTLENGSLTYETRLLEEDTAGKVPCDPGFNYKDDTAFHILAEDGNKEALNHPILRLLVKNKWKLWARKKFVVNVLLYLLSLFSLTFSVAVAATAADVKVYDTTLQLTRAVFEIVAYALILKGIANEFYQGISQGLVYFKMLFNWLELIAMSLLLLVLPVRYINTRAHWYIFALGYLLWVIKIFKYAVVFSGTGAYAESLKQILRRNVISFSLLFCIVNLAFGGTFLLVLKGDGDLDTHDQTSNIWDIWYVGLRTMIEAQPIVDYTGPEGYRPVGTIVMLAFMAMTVVVLLNILIAQLTDTYQSIQSDARKSDMANRAWIIARLERNEPGHDRQYVRHLPVKDLHMLPKRSSQMEKTSATVATIENMLVKTDLKVQTVKTRLRLMNDRLDGIKKKRDDYHF